MDIAQTVVGALLIIGQSFWLMFPAYVSGSAAVLYKGKAPMDGGRKWRGKRLFGDGKTWEGFIFGGLTGVFAGEMQQLISYLSNQPRFNVMGMSFIGTFDPDILPNMSFGALAVTACLSYGGLLGDLIKSFIKRRMGIERGKKSPFLMDQLDFVAGAWLLTIPIFWNWFWTAFSVFNIIVILIMTPLIHRAVNIAGYKLGQKREPW